MKAKLKHIKAAFEYFGYELEPYIKSESDLSLEIENSKNLEHQLLTSLEEGKESLKQLIEYREILEQIKAQIKVEEYKDLNPNAKGVFRI
ncbi:hypothetical protein [Runella limosa]|uniref:hypothetical protein n=1 Tax=Runella limosa TaxID=370978 RepID=UPI0004134EDA|nr:hypothetical protein [Runella limosa]